MQLRLAALAALVLAALAGTAHADGELVLRGFYYKERSTRVMQPMMDGRFDAGEHGVVNAHLLVDAITSASAASGAGDEPFSERRVEGGGGYTHTLGTASLGVTARYSSEPDYKSTFASVRGAVELLDRNLTLGATFGVGYDDYTNRAGGIEPIVLIEKHLDTYLVSLSASQILTPNLVAGVTYDLARLDGDQENVYRVVAIAGMAVPENHPQERTRHAVAGSLKWFVPRITTTVIGTFRWYQDDWTLNAGTPELRVIKDVGDAAWFGARYRYHRQSEAYFYERMYPGPRADELATDDVKLSAFETHTLGAQLEVMGAALGFEEGRAVDTRAQIVIEYVAQDNDFGNAVVAHAALIVPFEY